MAKKEKQKFTLVQLQIMIFTLIGVVLGLVISWFYYNQLFEVYMAQKLKYIEDDWSKTEYYANRLTDQVIALKKLLVADRVKKVDYSQFDRAVDIRARLIGADTLHEKVPLLKGLDGQINKVIGYYNSRMDLRNKRFSYIEWGMITGEYAAEYDQRKPEYNESADDFNGKIKIFPYSMVAAKKKYKALPLTEESKMASVQTATEIYTRETR